LTIHPQTHAIVAVGVEGVGLGKCRFHLAGTERRPNDLVRRYPS
jgi:hypothetical protein